MALVFHSQSAIPSIEIWWRNVNLRVSNEGKMTFYPGRLAYTFTGLVDAAHYLA